MDEARVDRRLAAIFACDIAGYSRLMGVDEEGTLHQLKAVRKELATQRSPSIGAGSSRRPATACWWNSSALSMLCDAPSTSSAIWRNVIPTYQLKAASSSVSESMSATLSAMTTI